MSLDKLLRYKDGEQAGYEEAEQQIRRHFSYGGPEIKGNGFYELGHK